MKIAARELNLLALTLAVILVAVTYLALEPLLQEWQGFREQHEELQDRMTRAQHVLATRENVAERLEKIRQGLPAFPATKKVEADLLLSLEKMAAQHGVVLTRRTAEAERPAEVGDLFETAITCDWEGTLGALVQFLFAQQTESMVSDVRHLSVQPAGGPKAQPDQLKGAFTIHYAYRRETAPAEITIETPVAESSAEAPNLE